MGSSQLSSEPLICISSSLPQPSSLLLWLTVLLLMVPLHLTTLLLSTRRRSFLLNHLPMSTALLMTTPKLTSRRQKLKMLREKFQDLSQSLFPMAEFRPPHIQPTTTMDLLLRSPMKAPLFTPQNLKKDTVMLPLSISPPLPIMPKSYNLLIVFI